VLQVEMGKKVEERVEEAFIPPHIDKESLQL
jgi:hypothetical protein